MKIIARFFLLVTGISLVKSKGIGGCKVLDLSHDLDDKNPYFPVYKPFRINPRMSRAGAIDSSKREGPNNPYAAWNFYETYEHLGTHIDAPAHFSRTGDRINEVPLETLIGEACVLDLSHKVISDRTYNPTVADLEEWEAKHGSIDGCIVLINTNQSLYFTSFSGYFGSNNVRNADTFRYSAFSRELAFELAYNRTGIKAIGVDCVSLDTSTDHTFGAHIIMLKEKGIPGYENLNNLYKLPPRGAQFIGAPIKIRGGTGAQVRAFALGWQEDDPCNLQNMNSMASKFAISLTMVLACLLILKDSQ